MTTFLKALRNISVHTDNCNFASLPTVILYKNKEFQVKRNVETKRNDRNETAETIETTETKRPKRNNRNETAENINYRKNGKY